MQIALDVTRYPIVVTIPPAGAVSEDGMMKYLDSFRELVAQRGDPFVHILDLRKSSGITPTQRRAISRGMEEGGTSQQLCRGVALVFDSTMLRGMLTAILWVRKPRFPTRVFSAPEEAFPWAYDMLRGGELQMAAGDSWGPPSW